MVLPLQNFASDTNQLGLLGDAEVGYADNIQAWQGRFQCWASPSSLARPPTDAARYYSLLL